MTEVNLPHDLQMYAMHRTTIEMKHSLIECADVAVGSLVLGIGNPALSVITG